MSPLSLSSWEWGECDEACDDASSLAVPETWADMSARNMGDYVKWRRQRDGMRARLRDHPTAAVSCVCCRNGNRAEFRPCNTCGELMCGMCTMDRKVCESELFTFRDDPTITKCYSVDAAGNKATWVRDCTHETCRTCLRRAECDACAHDLRCGDCWAKHTESTTRVGRYWNLCNWCKRSSKIDVRTCRPFGHNTSGYIDLADTRLGKDYLFLVDEHLTRLLATVAHLPTDVVRVVRHYLGAEDACVWNLTVTE
jgi:hypothetical protein